MMRIQGQSKNSSRPSANSSADRAPRDYVNFRVLNVQPELGPVRGGCPGILVGGILIRMLSLGPYSSETFHLTRGCEN